MQEGLQALIEKNQQSNFENFERIQEFIDDQERKMVDKQGMMNDHANCLE
jgi:hypothetical protein